MTLKTVGVISFICFTLTCGVRGQDDDSLAGSFLTGLFDTPKNTSTPADFHFKGSEVKEDELTVQETELGASSRKSCRGDCVNALFAFFCETIDSEADCPDEGSCCISDEIAEEETTTSTTARPSTKSSEVIAKATPASTTEVFKEKSRSTTPVTTTTSTTTTSTTTLTLTTLPPSTKPPQEKISSTSELTTTATTMTTKKSPEKSTYCRGVCTEPLFSKFCEEPEAVISEKSFCHNKGFVCCEASSSLHPKSQAFLYRRLKQRIRLAKLNVPLLIGSYPEEIDFPVSATCRVAPWLIECPKLPIV